MDYSTKAELVRALNDKFTEPVSNGSNTRYDSNTKTIYSNTGQYTIADIEEVQRKIADFSKKCTSLNSSINLDPSYVRYCNLIDSILQLCKTQMQVGKSYQLEK